MDGRLVPDAHRRIGFDPSKREPAIDIAFGEFTKFPVCPICLSADPTSREHVPPRALSGRVMTLTCEPCNHRLGASFESALADWFHERVGFEVARSDERYRIGGKALVRRNCTGGPLFQFDGTLKRHIVEVLNADGSLLRPRLPTARAVKLAILKSSYLAASVLIGRVQMTSQAERIRALLVAARDHPHASEWPNETLLEDVEYSQTYSHPTGAVTLALHRKTAGEVSLAVGLAGTVYARFPLDAEISWTSIDERGAAVEVSMAEVYDNIVVAPALWSGRSLGPGRFSFQRREQSQT